MTALLSDQEILYQISMKNCRVFDELYRLNYKKLYILSYKYVRNPQLAEEVVHDVFIKIWNRKGTLDLNYSLSSYLSKAVVNTSLNALKREKAKVGHHSFEEIKDDIDVADIDEAEALEQRILLLEQAIQQLPEQCRKILLMSKFEKLKQQEIAGLLNISIKTVKNHLTYGYKKLKEQLSDPIYILLLIIFILYRSF